jgi:hypothetical protein
MAVFGDTTPNTRIMTITNDTTATGLVIAAGNPGIYDVQEGAPGSGVFIAGAGNGIYRTTDSGASWTNITSTLGIKTWGRIFYQGGNVWHMFAQDGSFALSSDNGLTWTLTTVGSITNATGIQQNIQASYRVCVALDPVTGLYVILTAGGGIRTTPVSAPTGGWTIVTANGDLNTGYTDFCMTSAFMIAFNKGAMSYCLRTNLATWLKNIVLPSSVATFEPTSEMYEFGDGLLSWDMNNQNSAGAKLCYQIADGVNTFDHYVLPASVPVLLNGKKPYVRVS